MTSNACPDSDTLSKLLLGDLPDQVVDEWSRHVQGCSRCIEKAKRLHIADSVADAKSSRGAMLTDDQDSVLAEILRRGTASQNQAETRAIDETVVPTTDMQTDSGIRSEIAQLLSPPETPNEIGRLGGYRVLEMLGEGGMGLVFKAEDVKLERLVALKAMKPAVASSSSFAQRFLREAKATAAIEHHNIVQIYQVGEDRGVPFIAMQFLRGESLESRLKRKQRLNEREVLTIGRDVASGLQAAHETGLIHRDIKPDNIWLDKKSGFAKVLDFGLVRCADDDTGLTRTGMIMGTPRYMAPEQAQGGAVDHRSDLFSLGSVLYHIASGQAAFDGSNLTAMLIAVAQADPKPLSKVAPDLDSALTELIMRLLAKDPDDRPQTAAEVVEELKRIEDQREEPAVAAPAIEIAVETRSPLRRKTASPRAGRRTRQRSKASASAEWWRRRSVWIAAGCAAMLLLAGILFRFRSPDGTVVVELDGPVEVATVEVDNREVEFSPDGNQKVLFQVDPGKHSLRIKTSDGIELTTTLTNKPLSVQAGEQVKLRAWVERKAPEQRSQKLSSANERASRPQKPGTPTTPVAPSREPMGSLPKLAEKSPTSASMFESLPPLGSWEPSPTADLDLQFPSRSLTNTDTLPGLALRPAKLKGIRRWNVESKVPRGQMKSLAFSPNGKLLAVGTISSGLRVYDAATLELRYFFPTLIGINTVQFIDNETLSASVQSGFRLFIWNLKGTTVAEVGSSGTHRFSPDRKRCISQWGSQTHLRDRSGKVLRTLMPRERGHAVSPIQALAWSPDSRFVAALYNDHMLRVWDRDGEPVSEFKVDGSMHYMAKPIAWSPDGEWIGVVSEQQPPTVLRYKPSGEQGPSIQVGKRGTIIHFAWSPDGKQIFASGQSLGSITDVETGEIQSVGEYAGEVSGFAISADGTRVATGYPHLTVWDTRANQMAQLKCTERNLSKSVHWSPDGNYFVAGGYHRGFGLWHEDGRYDRRIAYVYSARPIVAWHPDGTHAALSGNQENTLILTNVEGSSSIVNDFACGQLEYSPSGRFLVAAVYRDSSYHIDVCSPEGELLQTIYSSKDGFSVRFHPTRDMLAIRAGDLFYTSDASDGWKLREISDHPPLSRGGISWSPDGKRILVGWNAYEYSSGRLKKLSHMTIQRPAQWAWSHDGRRLAHCYGVGVAFVDIETGTPIKRLVATLAENYTSIDWHPSRNMVLIADQGDAITCWDASIMEPYWQGVILPGKKAVTLTAAGQILHGDRELVEQSLVYYVENEDGTIELLKPSEFEKRIGESIFVSRSP